MLYAALAISLRHQTRHQLDVAIVPRPDWACGLGILAAITWTLLTAVYSGDPHGKAIVFLNWLPKNLCTKMHLCADRVAAQGNIVLEAQCAS